MTNQRKVKAVGLLSGGLDSTLAHALIKAQGIEVKAVNFYTGFCIVETQRRMGKKKRDGTVARNDALHAAGGLETEIELVDISGPEYLEMICNPRFGYGSNANPCIDCRIFMLKKAKQLAEEWGADFVFTGEVVGQRPKSQRRSTLRQVEKQSGLEGRLLRPLSAQALEPTLVEEQGLVDREKLLGLSGRGRKPQMALAAELGVEDYPQPAGGCCFLCDESFGRRFHDLMARREPRRLDPEEIPLLVTGRHFRISPTVKLVIGRNEAENRLIDSFAKPPMTRVAAVGVMGTVALVDGTPTEDEKRLIGGMVARYGQGRDLPSVAIAWGEEPPFEVTPLRDERAFEPYRI